MASGACFRSASATGVASARQRMVLEWTQRQGSPLRKRPRDAEASRGPACPLTSTLSAMAAHGVRTEARAIADLCKFSGIPSECVHAQPPLVQHPDYPWVAAIPDALLGANAVIEVKAPWRGVLDGDATVTLSTRALLQVHIQLECTARDFAIVVCHCGEYMHLFKVLRDRRAFHPVHDTTLWDACLPEYRKYEAMLRRGKRVPPSRRHAMPGATWELLCALISEYRTCAVLKMACPSPSGSVPDSLVHWKREADEARTNPDVHSLIDRVATASSTLTFYVPLAQRLLSVWWLNERRDAFYDPHTHGAAPKPTHGFVRSSYYSYPTPADRFATGCVAWGVEAGDGSERRGATADHTVAGSWE